MGITNRRYPPGKYGGSAGKSGKSPKFPHNRRVRSGGGGGKGGGGTCLIWIVAIPVVAGTLAVAAGLLSACNPYEPNRAPGHEPSVPYVVIVPSETGVVVR